MGVVVSILNIKGGVGKTTTAVNLGGGLGLLGKKVLVVDMDAQANTTFGFGLKEPPMEKSTYYVVLHKTPIHEIIQQTPFENVWVASACMDLFAADLDLYIMPRREEKLKKALQPVKNDYDYIIIDPPPHHSLLTINVLLASDYLLIPIQCGIYPLRGIKQLEEVIKQQKNDYDHNISVLGFLITMYRRGTKLSEEVENTVRSMFGELVFNTKIDFHTKIAEAPATGKPIEYYEYFSRGSEEYLALAREVIERVERKGEV